MSIKRNGFYIPKEIFYMTDLDWSNKVLLSEIYHILEHNETCYASNNHFSKLLGIGTSAASKRVTKLQELGYISAWNKYEKKACVGRFITYIGANRKDESKTTQSSENTTNKNCKGSDSGNSQQNYSEVQDKQKSTSGQTNDVLPEEEKGSSDNTTGVVPKEDRGGSEGQPNKPANKLKENNATETNQQISEVEAIIEGSSFITQLFFDKPVKLEQFKKAYKKYSSAKVNPMNQILLDMQYIFSNYPNWRNDLKKQGVERFMHSINNYIERTPEVVGGMMASFNRILQDDRNAISDQIVEV